MLKKRVIASLLVKAGILVQSLGFKKYLPIGKPAIAVDFLNQWGIDEIILLDISATEQGRSIDSGMIRLLAKKCFVPLSVGGGINHLDHVSELMKSGADKIVINKAAILDPEFITAIATQYGNQCVVVAIDVVGNARSGYKVYDHSNHALLEMDLLQWASLIESKGAGEIFLSSVDRDGSYLGFDLELVKLVSQRVGIPVIANSGCRNARHLGELFLQTSVSAGCAANFFHFTEHSVNVTKQYLVANGIPVRLQTHADYKDSRFDQEMRLLKKDDQVLENMLYIKIEREII